MKGNNKRFRNKRRGEKDNPKSYQRDERREERHASGDARNDISWYSKNPNLLVAAASFPYPNRPGMQLNLGTYKNAGFPNAFTATYPIPGCMVLNWMPNVGKSNAATDPASVLGKEMYARVRQVYSGSIDADAPDFVMYVLAMDSIFTYIAWLKRVYRVLNAWSPENYFTPDGLLIGMGFTLADIAVLRQHKTELWQCINELVLQTHKFTVPGSMDVFNRHYWMSDNVYTDAQSINSQFYMFNLYAVYKFMVDSGTNASALAMTALPVSDPNHATIEVSTLYQFGLDLINALVAWDDAYMINGYLRRAFEGDSMFIVDEIGATDILAPVYEPEVLMQIENSRALPRGDLLTPTTLSGFNVTQDVLTNAVICNPNYSLDFPKIIDEPTNTFSSGTYAVPPTLSVRSDTPTVADSVVASRLQAAVQVSVTGTTYNIEVDAGSEIPIMWYISIGSDTDESIHYRPVHQTPNYRFDNAQSAAMLLYAANSVLFGYHTNAFDWAPFIFIFTTTSGGSTNATWGRAISGDVHNITQITPEDLANLHRVCMYSEFNSFGLI